MNPVVRTLVPAAVATAVVTSALAGLGTWQVRRLVWKTELIAMVDARTRATPIEAPTATAALSRDPAGFDYTPVTIEGRFVASVEARVHAILGAPRGRHRGVGTWSMAPLKRADGTIVWINRGFVPVGRTGEAAPSGTVRIEGLMRRAEPRGSSPGDEPSKGQFFVRDPLVLAAAFGLEAARVAPYTIDAGAGATPPSGLPQAGETRVSFENRHLGYAITWYGLALAAIGVFAAFARQRLRDAPGA